MEKLDVGAAPEQRHQLQPQRPQWRQLRRRSLLNSIVLKIRITDITNNKLIDNAK